jgi:hypothetical protein
MRTRLLGGAVEADTPARPQRILVDRGTAVSSAAAGTANAVEEVRRLGRHGGRNSVNGKAVSGRHPAAGYRTSPEPRLSATGRAYTQRVDVAVENISKSGISTMSPNQRVRPVGSVRVQGTINGGDGTSQNRQPVTHVASLHCQPSAWFIHVDCITPYCN